MTHTDRCDTGFHIDYTSVIFQAVVKPLVQLHKSESINTYLRHLGGTVSVSVYVRDSYVTVRDILSIFFMLFRYTVPLDAFSNKNKFELLQVCLKRPRHHCEAQSSSIIKAVYVVKVWYLNYENRSV